MMNHNCHFYAFCGFGILLTTFLQVRAFTPPLPKLVRGTAVPDYRRSSDTAQSKHKRTQRTQSLLGTTTNNSESEKEAVAAAGASSPTILKPYDYDEWKLTYRTIADDETEASDDHHNVLLIHPVGIGIASWFWEPLLTTLQKKNNDNDDISAGSERKPTIRAYAPNLIGCGISEGSDAWDPDQRGMFVPLGWVKGCEALINHINDKDRDEIPGSSMSMSTPQKWTVVAQGGLAPIGVLLAARIPESVSKLVLTSPPTWKDMTTAVPTNELEQNYGFLRSPILSRLAFSILETRGLVEFFSNQFLFTSGKGGCDDAWLDKAEREMCEDARPPVQNFNAGMCMSRGLGPELTEDIQSKIPTVLVVQGENDKRQRGDYEDNMTNCRLVTLPGTNVVPWEHPEALADLLVET